MCDGGGSGGDFFILAVPKFELVRRG